MKKIATIFVVSVLVPSVVLAILALEAQDDQEFLIERQRALVHQGTVDSLAAEITDYLDAEQERFREVVRALLADGADPATVAASFDVELRRAWGLAETGFVTELESGRMLAPSVADGSERVDRFMALNSSFLCDGRVQELFAWQADGLPATPTRNEITPAPLVVQQDNTELFNEFRRQKLRGNDVQQSAFYKITEGASRGEEDEAGAAAQAGRNPAFSQAGAVQAQAAVPESVTSELPRRALEPERQQVAAQAEERGSTAGPGQAVATPSRRLENDLSREPFDAAGSAEEGTPFEPAADREASAAGRSVAVPVPVPAASAATQARRQRSIIGGGGSGESSVAGLDAAPVTRPSDFLRADGGPAVPPPASGEAAGRFVAPGAGEVALATEFPARDSTDADGDARAGTSFAQPAADGLVPAVAPAPEDGAVEQKEEVLPGGSGSPEEDAGEPRAELLVRNTMPAFPESGGREVVRLRSGLALQEVAFEEIVRSAEHGIVSRFVDGELAILFWFCPVQHPDYVFGAQVSLKLLREILSGVVRVDFETPDELCVALLDEVGSPVALSRAGFAADWSRPFVSREVGELLPRWEVAAYLVNPGRLGEMARVERLRIGLTVMTVLAAIGFGGFLIFLDYRRQVVEARQKTDFVSNVSHELKTPLTSIRMFSELLAGEGGGDPEKRERYAGVIQGEAGRLTRLINNVLDFARLERGDRRFERRSIDLCGLVAESVEHYRPQLERDGFTVHLAVPPDPVGVSADADAVSQVLVNLISNAEKYGADGRDLSVDLVADPSGGMVEVRVCDRGSGVPRGRERRIFKRFYRVDDSLASGVQGSGLGLTLARQIARAHGGDIIYRRRPGGGSCFVLKLPTEDRGSRAGRGPTTPGEDRG